jgi:hypothetical protein
MTSMKKLLRPDQPTPDVDRPVRFVQHQRHAKELIPLAENEYEVRDPAGGAGIVTIEGQAISLHWLNRSRQALSFAALLNAARKDELPVWVRQVPVLTQRIEAVFTTEREQGKDPHVSVGISGDEIFRDDLRRGIRISRKLSDLRADLTRGRQLPEIYDTPAVRAALGVEAA